ncbi:hypothetical protein LAT59_01410 [Candidatus Gracilibacteria bacterium]|nr:hypothetical protein [Candidatus Gracilibacteria bacterium]
MKKPARVLGKFQCKGTDYGFVIPDEKDLWESDFFVYEKNFGGAQDGQRVAAEVMTRVSGRRPEAKIVEVFSKNTQEKYEHTIIEGVFSGGNGDFGFIDVPGEKQGYFCYGLKKNGAQDGDRVRAEIKKYNGKDEAIVLEILKAEELGRYEGVYSDMEKFGFVKPDDASGDIFIAGSRKAEAVSGDRVEVRIIKTGGRRREGVIERIIQK